MNGLLYSKGIAYPTKRLRGAFSLLFFLFSLQSAYGNPIGPSVVAGGASVSGLGTNQVTIQQSTPKVILQWGGFNIAPNEVTRFVQPSSQAIALNRINDANPSEIFGSLQANGVVMLLNPNGILFGPGSQVNVNGLIASSLNLTDANFLNGRYLLEGSPLSGSVRNAGTIETGSGGFVYLLAPNVENSGLIKSPEGEIVLAAGKSAYLSNRPDGLGFLIEVTSPVGEATNLKDLIADGGAIRLFGRVVKQGGLIEANSVREKNGRIELVATDRLQLGAGSLTAAKGGADGISDGGTILALSDKTAGETRFDRGAVIDISGGAQGGNGGSAELSGHDVTTGGKVLGGAVAGFRGGKLLLDPYDLTLTQSDFDAQSGLSDITFQADHDINVIGVNAFLVYWPAPLNRGRLTFSAGNDLIFDGTLIFNTDPSGQTAGAPWDIAANAGRDIVLLNKSILGTGYGGNLTLHAGRDIVSPSALESLTGLNMMTGLRLDSAVPGTLTIDAGRNFQGGFVLSNGHAQVKVGGDFGAADNYVSLTLGKGTIDVSASQSIYLGAVQDLGLTEGVGGFGNRVLSADPNNKVSLVAQNGDAHFRPLISDGDSEYSATVRQYYPASFSVNVPHGNIFIESNLAFWSSPTGSLEFFAQNSIQGVPDKSGILPTVKLTPADPQSLVGRTASELSALVLNTPGSTPSTDAAPVTFKTAAGDISNITLNLYSPTLRKQILVDSGRDIKGFVATISVPEGLQGTIRAAGDIDMTPNGGSVSGLHFIGAGNGLVSAGRNIDLATSQGIEQRFSTVPTDDNLPKGLLEIAAGGNLEMTQSKIVTYNGASIQIHGLSGSDSPLGGSVDIGTNDTGGVKTFGAVLGIMTLRGGAIDIKATGDVNVNKSRVATFGGGDIKVTSTQGNINAGSGGKDESVEFIIADETIDPLGNDVKKFLIYKVPGSGIFTFHPDDPKPPFYPPKPDLPVAPPQPVFPPVPPQPVFPSPPEKTAEMTALEREIIKQRMIGHDTSDLEAALLAASEKLAKEYEATVNAEITSYQSDIEAYRAAVAKLNGDYQIQFADYQAKVEAYNHYQQVKDEIQKGLKLGNIELDALQGDVIVPPAGVRGKKVAINAKNLIVQEGAEISGDVLVNVGSISGTGTIIGPIAGNVGGGGIAPIHIELPTLPPAPAPTIPQISLPPPSTGPSGGAVSLGGLSGATGSVSSASSGSVSAASAVVASVQEKTQEEATEKARPEDAAADADSEGQSGTGRGAGSGTGRKGKGKLRSFQIRRGVTIQVEVNEDQP